MWSRASNINVVTAEVRANNLQADIDYQLRLLPINCIIQEIIVGPHHEVAYTTIIYRSSGYGSENACWTDLLTAINAAGLNITQYGVNYVDGDYYYTYGVNVPSTSVTRYLLTIVYNISNEPQEFKVNTNGSLPLNVKVVC